MHFSKNLVVRSSAGPKILDFGSHCSANFQPILDCFIPNFKLKYEDSENIKADRVSTVDFNLHQIKRRACFFWDTLYKLFSEFRIRGRMWLVISDLCTGVIAQVLYSGSLSKTFHISQGTGQGRILDPLMYKVLLQWFVEDFGTTLVCTFYS